jgi:PhnB protein
MTDISPEQRGPTGGLTPYLCVGGDGAAAASAFYQKAFAAQETARIPAQDGKRLMHCALLINGDRLLFSDGFPEHGHAAETPAAVTLHLQVDDADAWFKRAIDAGCEATMPVQVMFWGDRYGILKDPFGFVWSIGATPKA